MHQDSLSDDDHYSAVFEISSMVEPPLGSGPDALAHLYHEMGSAS
jgi:hypothetical protein